MRAGFELALVGPNFHQVVKLAQNIVGDRPVEPNVVGSGLTEEKVQRLIVQRSAHYLRTATV